MVGEAKKRVRLRVTGLVQGVFYRASTRERAKSLGITGWVRNTRDGAVELEAEGPADAIDELVSWCREGPPAARVARVDVQAIESTDADPVGFAIRY